MAQILELSCVCGHVTGKGAPASQFCGGGGKRDRQSWEEMGPNNISSVVLL